MRILADDTIQVSERTYDHPGRNQKFSTVHFTLPLQEN
jgi:hypothetical protein